MRTSFLALILFCNAAFAAPEAPETPEAPSRPFFDGTGRGWFWYQDPKDAPPKPAEPPPLPAPTAAAPPAPVAPPVQAFSVEWLRKNLPILLDHAIDNPTKENVEAFLYAQRVMMDKSQNYAESAQRVVLADPFLDENNRVPIASFARAAFGARKTQAEKAALKYLATIGGVWYFFDSQCAWCKANAQAFKALRDQHGFIVKAISVDGKPIKEIEDWVPDRGQAARLNVKVVPTTVFVVPPNNYFVISQGMMAQDDMIERLLVAADDRHLLPAELARAVHPESRGLLSPEDVAEGADKDPAVWVSKLKERLLPHY